MKLVLIIAFGVAVIIVVPIMGIWWMTNLIGDAVEHLDDMHEE